MEYYGGNGQTYSLNDSSIRTGGEGEVFEIIGKANLVAKVYKPFSTPAESAQRQRKIEAMIAAGKPSDPNIAWPEISLYRDSAHRDFAGFAMRRIPSGKCLNDLCAYPQSKNVSMRDKVSVAISVSKLTDSIHRAGHIIGDFNDGNVLVIPGGNAALVDCDSFDVHAGGKHYPCAVVKPGYNAPEVLRAVRGSSYQAKAAAGIQVFSCESDNFALAIHIFRLFFNGVHPFHCVSLPDAKGSIPAPISQDKRIERGETPFFKKIARAKAPDFTPRTSDFPAYITDLFKRAFAGKDPSSRPKASEWASALTRYKRELASCSADGAHYYHRSLSSCPYCAAECRLTGSKTHGGPKALTGSKVTKSPSSGSIPPAKGASGSAKTASATKQSSPPAKGAIQPVCPSGNAVAPSQQKLGKGLAWALSIGLALLIALLALLLVPLSQEVFSAIFGFSSPMLTGIVLAVGSVGAAIAFNSYYKTDTYKGVGLSGIAATAGTIAALPIAALFVYIIGFALVIVVAVGIFAALAEAAFR